MKMIRTPFKPLSLVLVLAFTPFSGCHSGDDDSDEDMEATEDAEPAELEEQPAPAEEPQAATAAEEQEIIGEEAAVVEERTVEPAQPSGSPAAEVPIDNGVGMGVIRFVKVDSTSIYAQPNKAGKMVGTLRKGDHVFVEINGGWAKIAGRGFIDSATLSDKPIARPRTKPAWKKH